MWLLTRQPTPVRGQGSTLAVGGLRPAPVLASWHTVFGRTSCQRPSFGSPETISLLLPLTRADLPCLFCTGVQQPWFIHNALIMLSALPLYFTFLSLPRRHFPARLPPPPAVSTSAGVRTCLRISLVYLSAVAVCRISFITDPSGRPKPVSLAHQRPVFPLSAALSDHSGPFHTYSGTGPDPRRSAGIPAWRMAAPIGSSILS